MKINHAFVSSKADGGDSTLVKPSDWNANHAMVTDGDGVMLGRATGTGPGPVQELPINSAFFPGAIMATGTATAPAGWLMCDGSLLNRADYPNLFTAIGTAFNIGGENTSQFRVPDLRGRVVAGIDGGAGRLSGWVMGTAGGNPQGSAAVYGIVDVGVSGTISVAGTVAGGASAGAGSGAGSNFASGQTVYSSGGNSMSGTGSIRNDGNNATSAFNIVQPTMTVNYVIKT